MPGADHKSGTSRGTLAAVVASRAPGQGDAPAPFAPALSAPMAGTSSTCAPRYIYVPAPRPLAVETYGCWACRPPVDGHASAASDSMLELSASYCRGDRPLRPAPAGDGNSSKPDSSPVEDGGIALEHHPGKLSAGPEGLRNHATSFPLRSSSPGEPWRALVVLGSLA